MAALFLGLNVALESSSFSADLFFFLLPVSESFSVLPVSCLKEDEVPKEKGVPMEDLVETSGPFEISPIPV